MRGSTLAGNINGIWVTWVGRAEGAWESLGRAVVLWSFDSELYPLPRAGKAWSNSLPGRFLLFSMNSNYTLLCTEAVLASLGAQRCEGEGECVGS